MKDQYIVYGRINKRGKKYFIVFDNIAQRGVIGKGNYNNEAAARAEAERLNAIARARIPAPLERGEHGNKVVLFKSEFIRMREAVEENADLRIAAAEGKQAKNSLEDLQCNLPGIIAKAAKDAANNAAHAVSEQYNQILKAVEGERDKAINERDKAEEEKAALLKENRALKDFIKNNL